MKSLVISIIIFFNIQAWCNDTYHIVSGEYEPFSGENFKGKGLSTMVVKAVFAQMGKKVQVEFMPWNRAMTKLENGLVDGSFPWTINEERKKHLFYSEPMHIYRAYYYIKKNGPMSDIKNWPGKTICQPDGWDISRFQKIIAKYKFVLKRPINLESCLKMLALGRIDLIALNEYVAESNLKKLFGNQKVIVASTHEAAASALYFVVPNKNPKNIQLIKDFNKGLEAIKKNGIYDRIIATGADDNLLK